MQTSTHAGLNPFQLFTGRISFPVDNTSDDGDQEYADRCDEIRTRQWRDLDASTVGDIAHDERLAEVIRAGGTPTEIGFVLHSLVHERIESIVRSAA